MAGDFNEIDLRDPVQGQDMNVLVLPYSGKRGDEGGQLVGRFTSLMFKIVNQTEVYLPLNSREPRALDGEVIVVWSLEQGVVDMNVVQNTFGSVFYNAFKLGRKARLPRARRFTIQFKAELTDADLAGASANDDSVFRNNDKNIGQAYNLMFCRVDTYSFGVQSGRSIAANAWQGTAQHVEPAGGTATK